MDLKTKISTVIEQYTRTYPTEYQAFRKQQKAYRSNLQNAWAELKGSNTIIRELNRYPETLNALIKLALSDAEYLEFRSIPMQKWFGNSYKDFKVVEGKI